MRTSHIVSKMRITGVDDTETTIVFLNEEAFAFSREAWDKLFDRVVERDQFLRALRKHREETKS